MLLAILGCPGDNRNNSDNDNGTTNVNGLTRYESTLAVNDVCVSARLFEPL